MNRLGDWLQLNPALSTLESPRTHPMLLSTAPRRPDYDPTLQYARLSFENAYA